MAQVGEAQVGAVWRAFDIVCDAPTLLILECAWIGGRRFDEFQKTTGLLKTVISRRLKLLVEKGIFFRHQYCERPARFEYRFTEMGLDLFPIALMMLRWEQKWSDQTNRIEIELKHTACGNAITPVCSCKKCGEEITAQDVERLDGPGANAPRGDYSKRRRQAGLSKSKQGPTILFEDISDIFGDRWAALVIRAAFMGDRRYDGFLKATGASTNILTDRLNRLVEQGLFTREVYQTNPDRHEYRLTEKAIDIYPILLFLLDWGERWFANDLGPSVLLKHKPCGAVISPVPSCSHCGQALTRHTIELTAQ